MFWLRSAVQEILERNGNDGLNTLESIPDAVPVMFTEPPNYEDQLAYHTLWSESQKLYGHGNEIFSLISCDREGKLVASSCKFLVRYIMFFRPGLASPPCIQ